MSADLERAKRILLEDIPSAEARIDGLRDRAARALAKHHRKSGQFYRQIAEELGVSTSYVQVLVQRGNGTPSPSRTRSET